MADALDRFPVFFGTFERRFDSKRRIALPSEWIPNPRPDYFLGFFEPGERLLRVYPKQFIDHLRNYTEAVIESDREAKIALRGFFRRARYLKLDPENRITLDIGLADKLDFSSSVVLEAEDRSFVIDDAIRAKSRVDDDDSSAYYDALRRVTELR